MTLQLDLPDEVLTLLGDEPQQEALEGVLLHLVQRQQLTVAKAGSLLGLDRREAINWYTSHGYHYPNYSVEDFLKHDLVHADQA